MLDSQRTFSQSDPQFPTTPALQAKLRARGLVEAVPEHPKARTAGPARPEEPPRLGVITIGDADRKPFHLDLVKLLAGRLLIQGSSGAGKSATVRRVIEEAHSHVTTIIVDPEGEFANLAEHIGATTVRGCEIAADGLTAVALKARAHRLPLHLDLTDLEPDQRILKAAGFFAGLLAAPRAHWAHTCLVAIDEAHLLAPHIAASARDAETRRVGVATLTELCSRGRKRGIAPIIATQRLAKLASSVLSELHNFLLGLNVLDRDVARAADLLGWSGDKAGILRDLEPGRFVAMGPALGRFPTIVHIRPTQTHHVGGTPDLLGAATTSPDAAAALLDLAQLRGSDSPSTRMPASHGKGTHLLDNFLLEPEAATATRIVAALAPISPNATTADELAKHLGATLQEVDSGLDLLARIGVVDTVPGGQARIARLAARLRTKLSETQIVGLAG